jgi:hypothetical protein
MNVRKTRCFYDIDIMDTIYFQENSSEESIYREDKDRVQKIYIWKWIFSSILFVISRSFCNINLWIRVQSFNFFKSGLRSKKQWFFSFLLDINIKTKRRFFVNTLLELSDLFNCIFYQTQHRNFLLLQQCTLELVCRKIYRLLNGVRHVSDQLHWPT